MTTRRTTGQRPSPFRKGRCSGVGGGPLRVGLAIGSLLCLTAAPGFALGLVEAVGQAISDRPELKAALHGISAAQERLGQAYAGFLPTIQLRLAQGSEGTSNPSTQRLGRETVWMDRQDRSISLSQNLFDGFRTSHQVASTQAGSRVATWRAVEAAESLAMRGVDAYLTVLKSRAQLIQSEQNMESHQRLLALAQQRAAHAIGSQLEVSQARSRTKRAESSVMQARGSQRVAEALFQTLFGVKAEGLEEQFPAAEPLPDYEEALTQALAHHPTILAARESLTEVRAREQSQNGSFSPAANLLLTASQGRDQGGVEGENSVQSAMLEVTFNLYSGQRDSHIRREAAFVTRQAEENLAKSRLDVSERLANAYRSWQMSRDLLQTHTSQAREARMVQAAYLEQYQLGKRTLLDLLDSESELSAARNSLIEHYYQVQIERYRVLFSQGRLLATLEIALPDMLRQPEMPAVTDPEQGASLDPARPPLTERAPLRSRTPAPAQQKKQQVEEAWAPLHFERIEFLHPLQASLLSDEPPDAPRHATPPQGDTDTPFGPDTP
ncbi:MAG: TolC family protein [Magnetococcus sp. MYC-9]